MSQRDDDSDATHPATDGGSPLAASANVGGA